MFLKNDGDGQRRSVDEAAPPRQWRSAPWATSTLFLIDGMTFGTWAALIPDFQHRFALSAAQLSLVLGGMVVGAMGSMPVAGQLIARRGSGKVLQTAGFVFPAMLLLMMLAPTLSMLILAAVCFGIVKGAMDVSANAQGVTVEKAGAKPVFSSFQAFWSTGGLLSAFLLSVALHCGASAPVLMGGMAALLMVMAATTLGKTLPDPIQAKAMSNRTKRSFMPGSQLRRLGLLSFLSLFSEGVLSDWSAVYAHSVAKVSLATAPVAFAAYSITMALGRAVGDAVIAKLGFARTLRLGGVLMMLGMGIVVFMHAWIAILIGFITIGFGISILVPIVFGATARVNEWGAGPDIAVVSTIGYTGFLCGPPTIGLLASRVGLPMAFSTVIGFGLVIATFGVKVIRAAKVHDQPGSDVFASPIRLEPAPHAAAVVTPLREIA